MKRTYELVLIADPRLSDEDAATLVDEFRNQLTADENIEISKEESWGKRKLAYPILKFNEGRYHLFFLEAEPQNSIREVEQRMRQHDQILRFLTVRTDLDLKRAASKGKQKPAEEEATA